MKSTLLYGGTAEKADEGAMTPGKFIWRLFHAVTAAHMLHLGSKNGTHHDALGKLYEDLLDSANELAEVYQGIDQSKIVPLLTAALQEAVAKIESLTQRIEALEYTKQGE